MNNSFSISFYPGFEKSKESKISLTHDLDHHLLFVPFMVGIVMVAILALFLFLFISTFRTHSTGILSPSLTIEGLPGLGP